MRTLFAALSIAIILVSAGCRPAVTKNPEAAPAAQADPKKEPPKKDSAKNDAAPEPFKKPPIRGASVVRRIDEADVKNMLRNLYIATTSFQALSNRYPNSREELEESYEKNPKINQYLIDGDLVYLWKARKSEAPAILAYEGQADTLGRRVVLLTNGDLQTVNEDEFKALPKVPTAK